MLPSVNGFIIRQILGAVKRCYLKKERSACVFRSCVTIPSASEWFNEINLNDGKKVAVLIDEHTMDEENYTEIIFIFEYFKYFIHGSLHYAMKQTNLA
jgi:hypothetical protein